MQTQEVITLNLWQIVISLANLAILTGILRRTLFAPVHRAMAQQQSARAAEAAAAQAATRRAAALEARWHQTMATAETQAEAIRTRARTDADAMAAQIVAEARRDAQAQRQRAQQAAAHWRQQAAAEVRQELVATAAAMTASVLTRGLDGETHRALLDAALAELSASLTHTHERAK